jgi:copper amine oxidase-like protein
MKKFISFVMAGAMVASLVPATAFAKGDVTATAKVVDAEDLTKDEAKVAFTKSNAPEVQLKVTGVDYQKTGSSDYKDYKQEIEVTLDNAEFTSKPSMAIRLDDSDGYVLTNGGTVVKTAKNTAGAADADAAGNDAIDALAAWNGTTVNKDDAGRQSLQAASNYDTAEAGGTAAALKTAKTELEAAKTAAAGAEKTAVTDAEAAIQTEKDKVLPFEARVRNAEADVTTAEEAVATAQDAYDAAVAAADGSDVAALATLKTAQADLVTAQEALATEQDALTAKEAEIAAALPALESTLADAKAAYDAAVADDANVIAKKAAVVTAEAANDAARAAYVDAYNAYKAATNDVAGGETVLEIVCTDWDDDDADTAEFTVYGQLHKDDVLFVDLASKLTKTSEGTKATVSIDSKMVTADDLVYASVLGQGLKASVKKTVDVAEEEIVELNSKGLTIESAVGNLPKEITLKISKGFEFTSKCKGLTGDGYSVAIEDDNELTVTVIGTVDEITIEGLQIEATSAKSGAVATISVKASNNDSASVEVAKVVDYKVSLSVDEDEDVPVIYSGVNKGNDGITDDSDHLSLEVTAEETFAGAWSMRKGFNFNLPEGVYVTGIEFGDVEGFYQDGKEIDDTEWMTACENAYKDGDHKNFEFAKRVFDDVDYKLDDRDKAKVEFKLELVADPTFEGDVVLQFEGDLVDAQEVTIAKFVKPYTVKAEQNDLIIDYRNTEIPTPIVITEAEEGLWEEGAKFTFSFDKDDVMEFEDDATFEIDADSELDVKDSTKNGTLSFSVKEESEAAATVTIKDMKLFMSRNIPAGAYDLEIATSLEDAYKEQRLFAADEPTVDFDDHDDDKESFVDDVCDYSDVVKEAFVNVVTSGRDNDNLFTTKVVVPVGEAYLVAGDAKVELDVPAYISAEGYTMLPVRAVSQALGVNTNNVLWNAEARTVTIMYGQRIISMTVGQKTIYVNGSAIPASAAPEIKDGRTFLPLRDLGTALGVTDVTWDGATKTATMNGGN